MRGARRANLLWNAQWLRCSLVAAIAGALACGALHGRQDGAPLAFDVASLKPHTEGAKVGRIGPGRYAGNSSIGLLISRAYGLQSDPQLIAPDWIYTQFLDIDARTSAGATQEQIGRMLQTLLAERLKLSVREETRTLPVYQLRVAKNGSRMKEVDPSAGPSDTFVRPNGLKGRFTMSRLADVFTMTNIDRIVLDQTGLKGTYDVDLRWALDPPKALSSAGDAPQAPPPASELPSMFVAIQEQLGLKLEPGRAPLKVVIVEHVERVPTAN